MIGIIICTHGKSATELLASAEMIVGTQNNIATIEFLPGEGPDDIRKKYQQKISQLDCEQLVFLVDLFGGSPFNVAAELSLDTQDYEVITGVNIPMIIEAASLKDDVSLAELCNSCLQIGKNAITIFDSATDEDEDELFS
ncbi:MAG: mannose/fructose/sorbose PTS transporter subunit IIA [Tissierellia bacterium]|nr:mannose/fructose/sorbose PTS transporter subunit IIA [Tissierellia bacterium]